MKYDAGPGQGVLTERFGTYIMSNDANLPHGIPVNSEGPDVKNPFLKKEEFLVEDLTEWNPAAPSRFESRIPQQVSRTTITVNERKLIFERSGDMFKLMGRLSDLMLLGFVVMLISAALGAVFIAGKLTGTL